MGTVSSVWVRGHGPDLPAARRDPMSWMWLASSLLPGRFRGMLANTGHFIDEAFLA